MKPVQLLANSFTVNDLDTIKKRINEVSRLFYNCESGMLKEGTSQNPETTERCLESYCSSLVTAYEILENGMDFLKEMRIRTNLALDELTRMESEGGSYENTRQIMQTGELNRALRKIDLLIDSFENMSFKNSVPRFEDA